MSTDFKIHDRGHSTYDVPHRFVASWVYELPVGRERRLLRRDAGVAGRDRGRLAGHRHRHVRAGTVPDADARYRLADHRLVHESRPNVIGDPTAGQDPRGQWVNPAAFDFPRDAQGNRIRVQGDAGRNSIQQPGINNWDIGVFKNFTLSDRMRLQFRGETFNTFNHTQFSSATLNMSNATSVASPTRATRAARSSGCGSRSDGSRSDPLFQRRRRLLLTLRHQHDLHVAVRIQVGARRVADHRRRQLIVGRADLRQVRDVLAVLVGVGELAQHEAVLLAVRFEVAQQRGADVGELTVARSVRP